MRVFLGMLAVAAGLLLAGTAQATVDYGYLGLTFDHCGPTEAASTSVNSGGSFQGPWYCGQYNLAVNPAPGSHSTGDTGWQLWANSQSTNFFLGSFCIDLLQEVPGSGTPANPVYAKYYVYDLSDSPVVQNMSVAMGTQKADALRRLFSYWQSNFSNQQAAAFQADIWEIINETTVDSGGHFIYNVTGGTFQIQEYTGMGFDGGWTSFANDWLNHLYVDVNGYAVKPNNNVVALVNPDTQDFALTVKEFGGEVQPLVPEPVTLAGVFFGIGGLAQYMRRRVRH